MTGGSSLAPRTLDEAMRFAELLAKSDLVPKEFKGRAANVLVAIQWGLEVGLQPLQALQNIAVINGRPAIWGDAALALVQASPVCDDIVETLEGEGDAIKATCVAKRKGRAPVVRTFSVADARKAGLWGKQGPWSQYPQRMLQQRARGFALRDTFPDLLRGVITREEAQDIPREPRDVTPPKDLTPDLDAFAAQLPASYDEETGEVGTEVQSETLTQLTARGAKAANGGMATLESFWLSLGQQDRANLLYVKDADWKPLAQKVDRERIKET